jgi:hypothetical protein
MDKRITNIVEETQQEMWASITHDDGEFTVEIKACSKLDSELKEGFHDFMEELGTDNIDVTSRTRRSNQGNELFQVVTLEFPKEYQLHALDIIDDIIAIGKSDYKKQLDQDLSKEEGTEHKKARQQLYFDDEAVMEFCLLYRGRLDI